MSGELEATGVDVRSWLPFGDQLRVLLSSDHISLGEVSSLARSKGLFAASLERSQLIQFLSTTLIRPIEFERLLEASVSRESKPKDQPQEVALTSEDADWQSAIKAVGVDLGTLIVLDSFPGTVFSKDPEISVGGKDRLSISYEISRQDYSKDLLKRDLTFRGEISVSQENGALTLQLVSTHTAKETSKINDLIIRQVFGKLRAAGVTKMDEPVKILFGSFDNKNRVLFLLRLAADKSISRVPGQISDLHTKPNEARAGLAPPPALKIFEGSIRNMRMDGSKLNELMLLTDDSLYEHFFLTRILVDYDFSVGPHAGKCGVAYYFQIPKKTDELAAAPLSFSIENFSLDKAQKSSSSLEAKNAVNKAVHRAVDSHYRSLRNL